MKVISLIMLVALVLTTSLTIDAQNGKILSSRMFNASSALIKDLNEEVEGANFADTFALATMEEISYVSNKLEVKGYIIRPSAPGKYPCLIYNRWGHKDDGILNEIIVARDLHRFARWGYVVVASQYRGYAGGEGEDEFGGEDVDDVLNLIPLLESIPEADTSRIGMYGINRGGMMTYLSVSRTQKLKAAIVESGISNLFLYAANNEVKGFYDDMAEMIADYYSDRVNPLKKRSVSFWTDQMPTSTPFLLMHGTSDQDIHPSETFTAIEQFFRNRIPFRAVYFEGGTNLLPEHQEEKLRVIRSFINDYVRDSKPFPRIINLER